MADISREEFVLLVRGWTRNYERGKAVPCASQEEVAAYKRQEWAQRQEEAQDRIARLEREVRLLARALASGRSQGPEESSHRQGYRVNLQEEEKHGREAGRGW